MSLPVMLSDPYFSYFSRSVVQQMINCLRNVRRCDPPPDPFTSFPSGFAYGFRTGLVTDGGYHTVANCLSLERLADYSKAA